MTGSPSDQLADDLRPGERLLWAGRARGGVVFRPFDGVLVPFSLAWCGITGFILTRVIVDRAPWVFALFAGVFFLVGLYLLAGRFWLEARRRRATVYGVTTDRIIIKSGLFAQQIKSLPLAAVTDITLRERPGGGKITFGAVSREGAWIAGTGWPGTGVFAVPTFELESEARDVYGIVLDARRDFDGGRTTKGEKEEK